MPRFFFHVYDDSVVRDEEGLELADGEAARRTAIVGLRAIVADEVKKGALDLSRRIEVEDESGAVVAAMTVADVVQFRS